MTPHSFGASSFPSGKNVLVVEFTGFSPHLETSLDIARQLSVANQVTYIHLGKKVNLPTFFPPKSFSALLQCGDPVSRAKKYIYHANSANANIKWLDLHPAFDSDLASEYLFHINRVIDNLDMSAAQAIKYKNLDIGIGVVSSLISIAKDSNPFPLSSSHKTIFLDLLLSSIQSCEHAIDIITRLTPDVLVLFNGRFACENAFKRVAISYGIKIYYHERGATLGKFFFEPYVPHDYESMKKTAMQVFSGLDASKSEELAKTFFYNQRYKQDERKAYFLHKQGKNLSVELLCALESCLSSHKKIVVYFSSSDDEYASISDVTKPFLEWQSQIKAVESLAALCADLDYLLIVRVHPHLCLKSINDVNAWNSLGKSLTQNGHIYIPPESPESSYLLLDQADIVVTGGSTIGIEAMWWRKDSIVINRCMYSDLTESTKVCLNKNDLKIRLLSSGSYGLDQDARKAALIYGCMMMTYGRNHVFYQPKNYDEGVMENSSSIGALTKRVKLVRQIKKYLEKIKFFCGQ